MSSLLLMLLLRHCNSILLLHIDYYYVLLIMLPQPGCLRLCIYIHRLTTYLCNVTCSPPFHSHPSPVKAPSPVDAGAVCHHGSVLSNIWLSARGVCGADVKPLMKDRPENQPAVGQNKGWSSVGFVLRGYTRSVVSQKCS